MKNINKAILLVSCLSLIISIVALCIICVRNNSLDFDWYGVLIGILSLLVTVLIGWNIYVGIDFDKRIELKIEKALSIIGEDVQKMNYRTTYSLLVNIAQIMKEQDSPLLAFDMYLRAAMFSSSSKDTKLTVDILNKAIEIFDVLMTHPKMSFHRKIFKSEFRKLDDYIDMLKLIDSDLSNSLITRIVISKSE